MPRGRPQPPALGCVTSALLLEGHYSLPSRLHWPFTFGIPKVPASGLVSVQLGSLREAISAASTLTSAELPHPRPSTALGFNCLSTMTPCQCLVLSSLMPGTIFSFVDSQVFLKRTFEWLRLGEHGWHNTLFFEFRKTKTAALPSLREPQ